MNYDSRSPDGKFVSVRHFNVRERGFSMNLRMLLGNGEFNASSLALLLENAVPLKLLITY